ncbi:hypothetical protein BU17DRAFT_37410 [Hysterangium stoloniferum]|nr:hypothetical protein BU17DRAFT_37410 [Hysterangium stoloniferum]
MTSPSSTIAEPPGSDALSAIERRVLHKSLTPEEVEQLRFEQERDTRQMFRRLLDPGIVRGVEKQTALSSMKTLLTLADNLLNNPGNDKFRQFKPTNTLIKRTLVDVKGALEYAVAMGFRANIKDFQPYYIFNDHKTAELRIGAAVLREHVDKESEKERQRAASKIQEKSAMEMQAKQVKLAFEDDRKRKAQQDKLDRERRLAREAAVAAQEAAGPASPAMSSTSAHIIDLAGGRTLASPPPYDEESGSDH